MCGKEEEGGLAKSFCYTCGQVDRRRCGRETEGESKAGRGGGGVGKDVPESPW